MLGTTKGAKRRRKHKGDPDIRDDESNGRLTPVERAKRAKGAYPHHQYVVSTTSTAASLALLKTRPNEESHSHHHHHHHKHQQYVGEAEQAVQLGITPFKGVKGSTPIPSPILMKGSPSQHHVAARPTAGMHQIQQMHQPLVPVASPVVVLPPRPKQIVNSTAVLEAVVNRPRLHLGDHLYKPSLKPTHQNPELSSNRGFKSTPNPLPWCRIEGKENSTLTVKIAKVCLSLSSREEITSRRALWGTEIYTDDSDVVAACIHGGWIRGEWSEGTDTSILALDYGLDANGHPDKPDGGRRRGKNREKEDKARLESNIAMSLDVPPKTGPVHVHEEEDLHVTVVILPKLQKYTSTTRFGMQSREFSGSHDGLSFKILGLRWVLNGAGATSRLRGKERRERMKRKMVGRSGSTSSSNGKTIEFSEKVNERMINGVKKLQAEARRRKVAEAKAKEKEVREKEGRQGSEGDKENSNPVPVPVGGGGVETAPSVEGDEGVMIESLEGHGEPKGKGKEGEPGAVAA